MLRSREQLTETSTEVTVLYMGYHLDASVSSKKSQLGFGGKVLRAGRRGAHLGCQKVSFLLRLSFCFKLLSYTKMVITYYTAIWDSAKQV